MKQDTVGRWKSELLAASRPEKIAVLSSFFKTGKGQYGEGDVFVGITVPDNRRISEKYHTASLSEITEMLTSTEHEFRLAALLAMVKKYTKARTEAEQAEIVKLYLANTRHINNWDLVDLSAPRIMGHYRLHHPQWQGLDKLSHSADMWERRIAIVSTQTLIRAHDFTLTKLFATRFLPHPEDLIHKATGWMLREMGKRDERELLRFLDTYAPQMPRTALRYAIERLSPQVRRHYMTLPRST